MMPPSSRSGTLARTSIDDAPSLEQLTLEAPRLDDLDRAAKTERALERRADHPREHRASVVGARLRGQPAKSALRVDAELVPRTALLHDHPVLGTHARHLPERVVDRAPTSLVPRRIAQPPTNIPNGKRQWTRSSGRTPIAQTAIACACFARSQSVEEIP